MRSVQFIFETGIACGASPVEQVASSEHYRSRADGSNERFAHVVRNEGLTQSFVQIEVLCARHTTGEN